LGYKYAWYDLKIVLIWQCAKIVAANISGEGIL
jgi:hypothetical protein